VGPGYNVLCEPGLLMILANIITDIDTETFCWECQWDRCRCIDDTVTATDTSSLCNLHPQLYSLTLPGG